MANYDEFLDRLAEVARSCVLAGRIRRLGHAERPNWREMPLAGHEAERKALLEAMSAEERDLIAALLEEARVSAVHDVLADMEWCMATGGMEVHLDGQPMAGAVRETLHGDFMARMMDEGWQP